MATAADKTFSQQGRAGIQMLLDAESRAAQIIEDAKKEKIKLMKQAKAVAEKEIAEFKAQQEAQLQSAQDTAGSNQAFEARLEANAVRIRESLATKVQKHSDEVISMLIDRALTVELQR